jgi:hypothetical protein
MITITPTRGDREKLVNNCILQMETQSLRPEKCILVNYKPIDDNVDLTKRIKRGCEVIQGGTIAIIEDDDYYPPNYIELITERLKNADVVGFNFTYYYHIKTNRWDKFSHPGRASLFCTAFKSAAIEGFNWPTDDYLFLDIKLWQYFTTRKFKIAWITEEECSPIGIKHNIGKTGGKGHTHSGGFKNHDPNWGWLTDKVGSKVEFYKGV